MNWMKKYGIEDEDWSTQYFYGLYYSATIMTTVGYGDINVSNVNEAAFVTFVMLVGCIIISYNISQVGTIMSNLA